MQPPEDFPIVEGHRTTVIVHYNTKYMTQGSTSSLTLLLENMALDSTEKVKICPEGRKRKKFLPGMVPAGVSINSKN